MTPIKLSFFLVFCLASAIAFEVSCARLWSEHRLLARERESLQAPPVAVRVAPPKDVPASKP